MRTKYFCVLVLFLSLQFGYGQEKRDVRDSVYFMNIPDEVIKKEIAFFSEKSMSLGYPVRVSCLKEVSPYICSDSLVNFKFGDTYINLSLTDVGADTYMPNSYSWGIRTKPTKRVASLRVVLHSHFGVKIPLSAVSGLYEPHICELHESPNCEIATKKKRKQFFGTSRRRLLVSDFYKVFTSSDRRRIYVYMLAGDVGKKYEVTWVFQNSEYLYRVIDDLVIED